MYNRTRLRVAAILAMVLCLAQPPAFGLVQEGDVAPAATDSGLTAQSNEAAQIRYRTHVVGDETDLESQVGWTSSLAVGANEAEAVDEVEAADEGQPIGALEVEFSSDACEGSMEYRVAGKDSVLEDAWLSDGALATSDEGIYALAARLTGEAAERYEVWYRVRTSTGDWQVWKREGEVTEQSDEPISALQFKLVKRNEETEDAKAPAPVPADATNADAEKKDDQQDAKAQANASGATGAEGAELQALGDGPHIVYQPHLQTYGWTDWVADGALGGTTGEFRRMEALRIRLNNANGSVRYCAHSQTYGWLDEVGDGEQAGTTGEFKRLEAIRIYLTGEIADTYDIWYRAHCQTYGWLDWVKNGEIAGTTGEFKRLEAIEILLKEREPSSPEDTASSSPALRYRSHVQTYGWMNDVSDGEVAGTTGQGKRMEAFDMSLLGVPDGGVEYRAHCQTYGWLDWVSDGAVAGTTGEFKRLEALQIRLTGAAADRFDVWYRCHSAELGWMGWTCNGEVAGTVGMSLRAEAFEVRLVPRNSNPSLPGGSYPGAAVDASVPKPENLEIKLVPELAHGYKSPYYQRCIVMHDTTEYRGFDYWIDEWIRRGGSGTQFMVNEQGVIRQYVDMDQICWHAGGATYAYLDDQFNVVQHKDGAGSAMNQCSIGIEIDHEDGRQYPTAQLDAIDRLIAYIDAYYGYECTILQHRDYKLDNGDCTPEFQGYLRNLQAHRSTR